MYPAIKKTHIETVYTLEEARKIIYAEDKRRRAKRKQETLYYMKQRFSGLLITAMGVVTPLILDGDATFSLLAIPLGLFLMVTREKVMMFR